MKLPLLLAQYLREHHHLRLPGVGCFYATAPSVASETTAAPAPLNIRFESVPVKAPDDGLIDFIKEKTGKIKPLAIADLTSYIESGLEMLNIGKPFYIDGIGTIQKAKDGGKYDFVARELTVIKQEEAANRKEEQTEKKKSIFDDEKYDPPVNPWQKIVVAALILGGLAIVVLGGYFLYNQKNGEANLRNSITPLKDSTQQQKDSLNIQADSTNSIVTYSSQGSGAYKFILETTKSKKRALKRYEQLKYANLKMEAIDSSAYKLYFVIPASINDTTRIKDSLSKYYASKVRIEQ